MDPSNPPGNTPLIEGLGPEWNEFVSYVPEDKRAEFGPKFKERISSYSDLEPWRDLAKSGVTPDHASSALNLFTIIENNPKEVYDTIGKHLGITAQQAEKVVEKIEENKATGNEDPRINTLQQQVETLAQIALAQRQMTQQEQQAAEQDAAIEAELTGLKKKYGEFPEDEIIMRMMYKDMTAEQAYQEYSGHVSEIQKRRPAPFVMGSGGQVPPNAIDPRKLDSKGTKDLVAQMLLHAKAERDQ